MSDPTSTHEEGPHEGPIKTPKQLVLAVIFATVVPVLVIILLATFVNRGAKPAAGSDGMSEEAIAARLQPVGAVEIRDASGATALRTGEQVYTAQCSACHAAGVAGAPKLGDKAAWGPRLAQGFDALVHSSIAGKGAMGPQGGGEFSDFEISRAVAYMANQGGGSFPEPEAPGGETTAAAAPAAAPAPAPAPETAAAPAPAPAPEPAVSPAPAAAPAVAAAPAAVPALYTRSCAVCHGSGVAGAPKLGDKAAWAPRIAKGMDALVANSIKGINAMPPRGASTGSDEELAEVVAYMVGAAQ